MAEKNHRAAGAARRHPRARRVGRALAGVIAAVVVLLTSWLGFAVYYFYAKDHLQEWFR